MLPDDRRAAPVELTTYLVRAVLLGTSPEKDNDIHVVIADPADRTKTMIAEIAAPGCSDNAEMLLDPARHVFVHLFGHLSKSWSWSFLPPDHDLIEVTGVGFFDFDHGQNGVAPNAFELHPVLGIRRVEYTSGSDVLSSMLSLWFGRLQRRVRAMTLAWRRSSDRHSAGGQEPEVTRIRGQWRLL